MNPVITKELPLIFYQKLSELFYAMASDEQKIGKKEYLRLRKLVSDQVKNLNPEICPFRKDATKKLEIVFNWFDYEELDPIDCYENFASYYKKSSKEFTFSQKKFILETSEVIAAFFKTPDSAENRFLIKLKQLLDQ